MSLKSKSQKIRMILSDVDGVLTDGTLSIDHEGRESKRFSTIDGWGIRYWQQQGFLFGLVTGRSDRCVFHRAESLKIDIVRMGIMQKRSEVEQISAEYGVGLDEIAFIGDDFPDFDAIQMVGLGITVPDAPEEMRQVADYVTVRRGGFGAVREIIEQILKHQNKWGPW
ncbi:MAG: KdsC family phosphatase [Thermoguttaceae bacterium]